MELEAFQVWREPRTGKTPLITAIYCGNLDVFSRFGHPEKRRIDTLGEGRVTGEIPLFTGHPARHTVVVASEFVEIYLIGHAGFREFMAMYPQISVNLGRHLALQLEGA